MTIYKYVVDENINKAKKPVKVRSKTGKVFTQMREEGKGAKTKTPKILYHVAFTEKVPKIKEEGVRPLQPTNWVQAGNKKRYGGGEVYAFEHPEDAFRWAAKMDWEFNKEMGSGKISVVRAKNDEEWEIDENDPMSQAGSKGNWLKHDLGIKKENIQDAVPLTIDITRKITAGDTEKLDSLFKKEK